MSKVKRIVGAITLLVSFFAMVVPALGQAQENTKRLKKRAAGVSSSQPSTSPSSTDPTTATSGFPAALVPVLLRRRNRSASAVAQSRTVTSGNAAVRQAPALALESQIISAGIMGEKAALITSTLSAPSVPASTTSAPSTSSTSFKGLQAPAAPKPVQ